MAKKFTIDLFDKRHLNNMLKRMRSVEAMFDEAVKEAARAGVSSGFSDPERPFHFDDFPAVRRKIDELIEQLHKKVVYAIEEGDHEEWLLSCEKNNELVEAMTRSTSIPKAQITQWKQPNLEALAAFQARKTNGLGLSDRVWNITEQFKQELELALDIGLGEGKSAADLTSDVRRYLNEPERLFRRVRDKHGVLRLSKAAKAYHPGQGVYRSSYKNALRLTATENNIAYRTSDYNRWQQLDFVVGIEIRCSNNHPDYDVCDELKGKYPKDFKFTGWHPFCRCHAVPILKTAEEMAADNERIMNGEPLDGESVNAVTDVPQEFKGWIKNNTSRIVRANQLPYFMTDNIEYVSAIMQAVQPSSKIASQMTTDHFWGYFEKFKEASPKMAMLYKRLSKRLPDSEKAIMINQVKHECASLTHHQLLASGHIGEDWVLVRKEFNAVIQEKATYVVKGKLIALPATKIDLLVYRDTFGREFAYPLGADSSLFKATTASAVLQEFPPYLRRGVKRVSFLDMDCPADAYWKAQYNNPKHRSMATDGGRTTFWGTPLNREDFKGYMSHEAGHILDRAKRRFSSSVEWKEAVSKDDTLYAKYMKGQHRVSSYAKTNDAEDFAECIRMYIQDHDYFKKAFPNRAAFIRKMAQKLSGHYKS